MVQPVSSVLSTASGSISSGGGISIEILTLNITTSTTQRVTNRLQGHITEIQKENLVTIRIESGTIQARLPAAVHARKGDVVEIELPQEGSKNTARLELIRAAEATEGQNKSTAPAPSDPSSHVPVKSEASPVDPALVNRLRTLSLRQNQDSQNAPSRTLLTDGQVVQLRPIQWPKVLSFLKSFQIALTTTLPNLSSVLPGLASLPPNPFPVSGSDTPSPFFHPPSLWDSSTQQTGRNSQPATPFPDEAYFLSLPRTNGVLSFLQGSDVQEPASFLFSRPHTVKSGLTGLIQGTVWNISKDAIAFLSSPSGLEPAPPSLPPFFQNRPFATGPTLIFMAQTPQGQSIFAAPPLFGNDAPFFYQIDTPLSPLSPGSTLRHIPTTGGNTAPILSTGSSISPLFIGGSGIVDTTLLQSFIDLEDLASHTALAGTLNAPRPLLPTTARAEQMGSTILFFLAALRSGDFEGWLSDRHMDLIRRNGKGNTSFDRLSALFSSLRQRLSETNPAAEWRSYPVPVLFQDQLLPVHLHIQNKNNTDQNDSNQQDQGQRFVLDLSFDRMGAVQMDLLYHNKNLDSILRTELPFSQAMRGVLEKKYASAMGKTGLTGCLYFQDGLDKWVTIAPCKNDVTLNI